MPPPVPPTFSQFISKRLENMNVYLEFQQFLIASVKFSYALGLAVLNATRHVSYGLISDVSGTVPDFRVGSGTALPKFAKEV
jgi:hypothetical protein